MTTTAAGAAHDRVPAALGGALTTLGLDPAKASLSRRGSRADTFLVLPSVRTPRLLIPLGAPGARVVRDRAAYGWRRKALRRLLAAALSSSALPALPVRRLQVDDERLDDLTSWLVGGPADDVRLGILLGPERANRKAVIRMMSAEGRTLGYAKVGTTDLTRALVRAEAERLDRLAAEPPTSFRVPQVVRFRDDELTVLVTSPLAQAAQVRQPTELPVRETRELFRRHEDHSIPLDRLPLFSPETSATSRSRSRASGDLAAMRRRLLDVVGTMRLPVGDSHGDWAPQNMTMSPDGLEVWDWERHATGVPQGLDVIHFLAAKVDPAPGRLARTEQEFLAAVPSSLGRCGVDPINAGTLLALYLLWVACRYATDLELTWSGPTHTRLQWVLARLEAQLRSLENDEDRT